MCSILAGDDIMLEEAVADLFSALGEYQLRYTAPGPVCGSRT